MSAPFPVTAEFDRGRLTAVGGVAVRALAERFGTPLYVLDHAELVGRMRAYRRAFGGAVEVAYASKALCVTGVLQIAAAEGLSVDVASAGELATALEAGVPPGRLLLHGNNKSRAELEMAVAAGVGRIVVDSFAEIALLRDIAGATGRVVPVLVRVTPGVEAHTHEFIRTGHDDSKFGFTLTAGLAHRAAAQVQQAQELELLGAHAHVGSQILRPEAFDAAAVAMVGFLASVRDELGILLGELNLGGGLGITYTTADVDVPSPDDHAAAVLAAVAREVQRHGLEPPSLTVEPGRSIVGNAGLTLYRVGTVKDVPGVRTYVAVDGGMSDNPRPALYDAVYEFAPAGDGAADGAPRRVTVVGKHCESGDLLGRDVLLPETLQPGDLLAVAATGAYGYAMASNYNRLPRPAMVLVVDGQAVPLVRRETVADVLAHDVALPDFLLPPA